MDYEAVNQAFQHGEKNLKGMEMLKEKLVFIIIYQTGEHNVAENKIMRVLNSMDCYLDNRRPDSSNLCHLIE